MTKQEERYEEVVRELSCADGRKVLVWLNGDGDIRNVGISLGSGYGGETDGDNPDLILESSSDVEGMDPEEDGEEEYAAALYDQNYIFLGEEIGRVLEERRKEEV